MHKRIDQTTWDAIKTDYLAGNDTFRAIGKRHNADYTAICRKAKKENWQALRENIQREADERAKNAVVAVKISNTERAINMTTTLMAKLEDAINLVGKKDVSAMRGIVTSLKDLSEMGVFRVVDVDGTDIRVDMGNTDDYSD